MKYEGHVRSIPIDEQFSSFHFNFRVVRFFIGKLITNWVAGTARAGVYANKLAPKNCFSQRHKVTGGGRKFLLRRRRDAMAQGLNLLICC